MPDDAPNTAARDDALTAERSGEDVRRRGWFWHWNSIITQYAPLLGLKGVGLLNSYTVWTDRREESPLRGYAFPSQQAEADFYGEDRAELITINKILVTLDLIEIRKEMVLRADERGRRWRVPHNLYRVKDHVAGFVLTPEAVMRVVALAERDPAVYRYIRRIFSPRFTPIDRDNVWHQILPALRQEESWQRLAAQAEREEARASARTKAGHASRSRRPAGDTPASCPDVTVPPSPSSAGPSNVAVTNSGSRGVDDPANRGLETSVAASNAGLGLGVDPSNDGSPVPPATIAGQSNEGKGEVVDESNSTYYQGSSTTTTTTARPDLRATVASATGRPDSGGAGPLPEPAAAALACFEAANGRDATPLERELLAELAATFHASAAAAGATGDEWVVAAIREAVSSGSRFVAPKRIREILARWSAEGADPLRPGGAKAAPVTAPSVPDVPLPRGQSSRQVWDRTLHLLSHLLDAAEMERLFAGSAIAGYQGGVVTVVVPSLEAAERLGAEYYELIARKLGEVMRRSVQVRFRPPPTEEASPLAAGPPEPAATPPAQPPPLAPARPRFVLPAGLTNLQVWATAQEELAGRVTPANYEAWIRTAALIGHEEDGALIIGAPNAFAQRRLTALLPQIGAALSGILARPVEARIVIAHEWLRSHQGGTPAATDPAASA